MFVNIRSIEGGKIVDAEGGRHRFSNSDGALEIVTSALGFLGANLPAFLYETSPGEMTPVILPGVLVNASSISKRVELCSRKNAFAQLGARKKNYQQVLGTLVHETFERILRVTIEEKSEEGIRGREEMVRSVIESNKEMFLGVERLPTEDSVAGDILAHIETPLRWVRMHFPDFSVLTEEFLASQMLGIEGRADVILESPDKSELVVMDLKTGRVSRGVALEDHSLQLAAYMMMVRESSPGTRISGYLLYSQGSRFDPEKAVFLTRRLMSEVIRTRNLIVLENFEGAKLRQLPSFDVCLGCEHRAPCSVLFARQEPQTWENLEHRTLAEIEGLRIPADPGDGSKEMLRKLESNIESEIVSGAAGGHRSSIDERVARGTALKLTGLTQIERRGNAHVLTFIAEASRSSLRRNDSGILRSADGRITASAKVVSVSDDRVVLETDKLGIESGTFDIQPQVSSSVASTLRLWLSEPEVTKFHLGLSVANADTIRHSPETEFSGGKRDSADSRNSEVESRRPKVEFNERQRFAIERALSDEPYTFILGPPGSGKTRVLATIARELLRLERSVLFVSVTHNAVDNFAQAVHDLDPELFSLSALRLGRKEVVGDVSKSVTADEIVRGVSLRNFDNELEKRRLVLSTLASARRSQILAERIFGALIVDEAGQVPIPELALFEEVAAKKIVCGDPEQLPGVVTGETYRELRQRSLIGEAKKRDDPSLARLNVQYRMNEEIMRYSKEACYDGDFFADESVRTRRLSLNASPENAALYPSKPFTLAFVRSENQEADEAEQVVRIVSEAVQLGVRVSDIGVIAPYRRQVARIRGMLAAAGIPQDICDTVDRFQGREREIAIISVCDSAEPGYLFSGDFGRQRLNVAITRAKSKCIIVGNREVVGKLPAGDVLMRALGLG
ncbi:MAG: AAA domain-containing protein [Planctomycetes bacterium]|nr:AAA domain-containing protein [Planctomycetota bacterium]